MIVNIKHTFKSGETITIPFEFEPRVFTYFPVDIDWWNYSPLRQPEYIHLMGAYTESLIVYAKKSGKVTYEQLVLNPYVSEEEIQLLTDIELMSIDSETRLVNIPKADEIIYKSCSVSLRKKLNGQKVSSVRDYIQKNGTPEDLTKYLSDTKDEIMGQSRANYRNSEAVVSGR